MESQRRGSGLGVGGGRMVAVIERRWRVRVEDLVWVWGVENGGG